MDQNFRIFTIGASAGGYYSIETALREVPATINAAFLVVIHSSFDQPDVFGSYLKKKIS